VSLLESYVLSVLLIAYSPHNTGLSVGGANYRLRVQASAGGTRSNSHQWRQAPKKGPLKLESSQKHYKTSNMNYTSKAWKTVLLELLVKVLYLFNVFASSICYARLLF